MNRSGVWNVGRCLQVRANEVPEGCMTPRARIGSDFLLGALSLVISLGCGTPSEAPPAAPEAALGVTDRGIWSDLDERVQIDLPADLAGDRVDARLDEKHALLVL